MTLRKSPSQALCVFLAVAAWMAAPARAAAELGFELVDTDKAERLTVKLESGLGRKEHSLPVVTQTADVLVDGGSRRAAWQFACHGQTASDGLPVAGGR